MLGGSVPSGELLGTRSNLVVAIPLVRCHVVILSQSCDAEDVERKNKARNFTPVQPPYLSMADIF